MPFELNPLLVGMDAPVDYAAVRPEHIAPAIESLLARARCAVDAAANPSLAAVWETVITPLDDACEPLWRAWSIAARFAFSTAARCACKAATCAVSSSALPPK